MIFEYDKVLPHLIILSTHFKEVGNGTILQGELELIVTAMNARSKQPLTERQGDDENDQSDLLFARETRFPVCTNISYYCLQIFF